MRWRLFGPLDARVPLGRGHHNGAEVRPQAAIAEGIGMCMEAKHGKHVQPKSKINPGLGINIDKGHPYTYSQP